jgi:hypothetical protein
MDMSIILEKNPWRENPKTIESDRYVKEALSKKHKILYEFNRAENIIFIGPRRVGKTTFFKLLIRDLLLNKKINPKDVLYVSCEILKDYRDILNVLRLIKAKYYFLDEITFVEGWERAVKFALDQEILEEKILYITGSSTAFLKKETFPGRKIKFERFMPFDFFRYCEIFGSEKLRKELRRFREMEELMPHFSEVFDLFLNYMCSGGFPKPALELIEEGEVKEDTYEEVYSWFRGDTLKLGKNEEIMKALILRVLETLTTLVSYNSLAGFVGVNHRIIREYIETLKNLMYLDFCYQIDINKRTPIFRKEKKIYFSDPFIVKCFEKNVVGKKIVDESKMAELIAFNTFTRKEKVYVYKYDKETDFFVEDKKIEVKWSGKVKSRKGTIVLTKDVYDQEKRTYPLPIFLLFYLKLQPRTTELVSASPSLKI